MKAVLISIRPEWCSLIVDGQKTIEVRKTRPKLETPFKCYIYCTYGRGLIEAKDQVLPNFLLDQTVDKVRIWGNCCNGKIIGEFVCNIIEEYWFSEYETDIEEYEDVQNSCLSAKEILDYGDDKTLYFWNISELKIYDRPMELSEFRKPCKNDLFCEVCAMYFEFLERCGNAALAIERAPQSWCYVEEVQSNESA